VRLGGTRWRDRNGNRFVSEAHKDHRLVSTNSGSEEAFNELCGYTLTHTDPSFIHQHVVDAFAAQDADEQTKPIKLTFALIGLYLYVEKQFSGKEVQRGHQLLARRRRSWPRFPLPRERGSVTAEDVIGAPAGPKRDKAIHDWCVSVWDAFHDSQQMVKELLDECEFRTARSEDRSR
jgi:Family of unknown function (DUF5946)